MCGKNYKRLGKYIELVQERNKGANVTNLMGVSIAKKFIPSIANIIGTDLSTYRIVHPGNFAFCPVTSRNGEKITIARYKGEEDCIISQAYLPFRVIDENELDPDYLMMWVMRPEFDRYARFHSHGSVRELFSWEEMCNVYLPIPDIDKQRKIVAEYQAIEQRIENNNRFIKTLEDTAQAIYHHTFVENIDPDKLPDGWIKSCVSEKCKTILGGTPSRDVKSYWGGDIPWINSGEVNEVRIIEPTEYITKEGLNHSATKLLPIHTVLLAITGATLGQISVTEIETCANQSVIGIENNKDVPYEYVYCHVKYQMKEILRNQTGGAQPHINKNDVDSIVLILPPSEIMKEYHLKVKPVFDYISGLCFENSKLKIIQQLLTSKM